MGDLLTPVHLIIVLGIALLVFGPKRLPELGSGLGKSLREFREATSGMTSAFNQQNLMATDPRQTVIPTVAAQVPVPSAAPQGATVPSPEGDMDSGG